MFEVAKRTWTPMWPGHVAGSFEIAPDASWVAATDKQGRGRRVGDRQGDVRARRHLLVGVRESHSVALFDMAAARKEAHVVEIDLEPTPTWHEDPLPMPDKNFPFVSYYRAGTLNVVTATSILHYHDHVLVFSSPMVECNAFVDPRARQGHRGDREPRRLVALRAATGSTARSHAGAADRRPT